MSDTAFSIKDLSVRFDKTVEPTVKNVSLQVDKGKVTALVGESGSGKSVTMRAALNLLEKTAKVSGHANLEDGTDLVGLKRSDLDKVRGSKISMIFQDPRAALHPMKTIGSQIKESLFLHQGMRSTGKKNIYALLESVGLEEVKRIAKSYPHQVSGGQLQRACIAMALAGDPEILVADEPTTALDMTAQAGILKLLKTLADKGLGIIIITHDMGVVSAIADDVVVLRDGKIIETGEVKEVFSNPKEEWTKTLLDSVLRLDNYRDHSFDEGKKIVSVKDLEVTYKRFSGHETKAVRGVSFDIYKGQILGLVGESGSGKSTIGSVLLGAIEPTAGSVTINNIDLAKASKQDRLLLSENTAVVQQNPFSALNPRKTIEWSVSEPLMIHRSMNKKERQQRVYELLEQVGLSKDFASRYPHNLSGGERQRVAIARALILEPDLLIADEPTSALDVTIQAAILELFTKLHKQFNFSCLFISHDLAVISQITDNIVVLSNGKVIEEGTTREILTNPKHNLTKKLISSRSEVRV